jgi:nicotinamidase-related amidase
MRVWDKFLSDRDKRHLEKSKYNKLKVGFGEKPALVLIDNYVAGLGHEPLPLEESMQKFPISMGLEGWEAVKQQKRLLELCRKLGMLVIHTNMDIAPNSPRDFYSAVRGDPRRRTMLVRQQEVNPFNDPLVFDFTPQLKPRDEEIVLYKSGPSAFHGTSLLDTLIRYRIDTLLIGGNSTSGCVRSTVIDAGSYCYRTIVVEECVYDRTEASHAISLFDMDQKYADVLGIDEVYGWVEKQFAPAKAG